MWEIKFYETSHGAKPLAAFLRGLPKLVQARVLRDIELLESEGLGLRLPKVRYIHDGIFELRTKGPDTIVRIFYFFFDDSTIVLTNGYKKKQQKMDSQEFAKARKYKADWEARKE